MKVPGVLSTVVGYTGGRRPNPTYRSIMDHTEALQVEYDPRVLPYERVVEKFFTQHDPTRACSSSRQYRIAIWFHTPEQETTIRSVVAKIEATGKKVSTAVEPMGPFYDAEDYHQKYLMKNK
mmetsp:Transcript_510/g.989  ORF Transcript_510/g.989 Transcript_510/m.989 type:complete len:122 (-) Transcript_510:145-510(-)